MTENVNPLIGRRSELAEIASDDSTVEEQLAGGASVDDLIEAGVLYDKYYEDENSHYSFTPVPTEEEIARRNGNVEKIESISEAELRKRIDNLFKHNKASAEHRKRVNRQRIFGSQEDASDSSV